MEEGIIRCEFNGCSKTKDRAIYVKTYSAAPEYFSLHARGRMTCGVVWCGAGMNNGARDRN